MGWQSYVVALSGEPAVAKEEFKVPIEKCKDHNLFRPTDDDPLPDGNYRAGEELVMFCFAKQKNNPGWVVMFGNGGGRNSTFAFFARAGIEAQCFDDFHNDDIDDEDYHLDLEGLVHFDLDTYDPNLFPSLTLASS